MSETAERRKFPKALEHLKELKGWLCWKNVPKKGDPTKMTKEPRNARAPKFRASNRKPAHWDTYKVARHSWKTYQEFADGVGFVVNVAPEIVWIDLDGCRNPDTGALSDSAMRFLRMVPDTYVEITPSGRGLRIIGVFGNGFSDRPIHKAFRLIDGTTGEVYYRAHRYVTVTGNRLEGRPDVLGNVTKIVESILGEAVSKRDGDGAVADRDVIGGDDDLLSEVQGKDPVGYSSDQIRKYLESLPPHDAVDEHGAAVWGYDSFMEVVFALHHETGGSEEGFSLLDEWAANTPHYNEEGLREKWNSPRGDVLGQSTITFASIIKRVNDWTRPQREEKLDALLGKIGGAQNRGDLQSVKIEAQDLQIDDPTGRAVLAAHYRVAFKRITGSSISESAAKRDLAFRNPDLRTLPDWLRSFVWVRDSKRFFDTETGQSFDPENFDLTFGKRFMSSEEIAQGGTVPSDRPTTTVLTRFNLLQVDRIGYKPYKESEADEENDDLDTDDSGSAARKPRTYASNGLRYVNNFHMRNAVPAKLRGWTAQEKEDIKQIRALFYRITGNERDCGLLLSFIRHILVERTRIPWAIIIIGAEKSGKTTAMVVITKLLFGSNNVGVYDPQIFFDKTSQGWKAGHLLKVVEEVWMPEFSKTAVIERIKSVITNSTVSARIMYEGEREITNTASYIGLTNHQDVLAFSAKDSRFYPIMSPLTATAEAVKKLQAEDPTFYTRVHEAVERSLPAFRGWLERRFKPHPDFDAVSSRAPSSETKDRLIEETQDPLERDILALLDREIHPLLCREIVSLKALHEALVEANIDIGHERGKRQSEIVAAALRKLDYRARGQFRVTGLNSEVEDLMSGNMADNRTRIYTNGVGRFDEGELTARRIQAWIDTDGL